MYILNVKIDTKYLIEEFYDFTVTDTMRNVFILESKTNKDL